MLQDQLVSPPLRSVERVCALLGALLVLLGVSAIWVARTQTDLIVYVSGLGAPSMPTAPLFNTALLVLGIGGALSAASCRGVRSSRRPFRMWSVAVTLLIAGAAFIIASRVTCTDGCPVPLTPGSTVQDLVHVTAASIGFATAALAMIQVATSPLGRAHRIFAASAAIATAGFSAAGATLSLVGWRTDIGALLEFVAMTAAVLWLVAFALLRALTAFRPSDSRA